MRSVQVIRGICLQWLCLVAWMWLPALSSNVPRAPKWLVHEATLPPPLAPQYGLPEVLVRPSQDNYLAAVTTRGYIRWTQAHLPIKVYISAGDDVPGYKPMDRDLMVSAFDCWIQASANRLAWILVCNPDQADVTVTWSDSPAVRQGALEAGNTTVSTWMNQRTSRGIILSARIKILTQLGNRQFTNEEMSRICLHEVGHALGLQGHSSDLDDIMYPTTTGTQKGFLTDRDVATISALYANYPSLPAAGKASAQTNAVPWPAESKVTSPPALQELSKNISDFMYLQGNN